MQKDDDFLKSPAEAPVHRKVLLEDKNILPKTQEAFDKLCKKYDDIISKNSGDIGKTMLVEMEIDTGNHPPIASKPYTLPLKHYEWVQREIETLEKAGIIERSISPWASPIVIVPKKSAPGEPIRRRMCVDYRRINKLQPEVTNADGGKGCISLCTVPFSLFADPERILRRLYVFAEEPCKSTNTTSEPCSPVFKEAQPRPSDSLNLKYHINNLNLYLYVFGL